MGWLHGATGWWIVGAIVWVIVCVVICMFVSIAKAEKDDRFNEEYM
jgi:uncharacterized membrane protein